VDRRASTLEAESLAITGFDADIGDGGADFSMSQVCSRIP
jgi:hypothetical protein